MTEALVIPPSSSILPFPCSFPSIRMKLLDISQLIGLCTLAYTGSLYQHFPCPTPLTGASIGCIETYFLYLYLSPFPLHVFFLPPVTFLLLLYPSSICITSIPLGNRLRFGVLVVSWCIQVVMLEPGNSRKEQGMGKSRGEENNR